MLFALLSPSAVLASAGAAGNVSTGTAITVTTSAGTVGALETAILALSPIGYWKLDETGGTTAADSSGNGRNGTYGGTYTLANRDGFATFADGSVNIHNKANAVAVESLDTEYTKFGTKKKIKVRDPIVAISTLAKLCGWNEAEKVEASGIVEIVRHDDGRG